MMTPVWFHIDMDAFFAAIEQQDNPEYRGKPVIVGARPGQRGVVSTCSYEARKFGVRSAMPVSEAYRLCPKGIFVAPNMGRYQAVSLQIMTIFSEFAPRTAQVSVDEAFLDLSGTERLLGAPEEVAGRIKERVRASLGLTLSIGIASNKFIAKLASAFQKPDGLTIVPVGTEETFVLQLPLDKIWGLGNVTFRRLQDAGIKNTETLHSLSLPRLQAIVGKASAEFLAKAVHGVDPGIYENETRNHSISNETTFERDTAEIELIENALFELCNQVMYRLRHERAQSRVVAIKIRLEDFSTYSAQKTFVHEIQSIEEVYRESCALLRKRWDGKTPVRLIGLALDKVVAESDIQASLFEEPDERRARVEQAVASIKDRYSGAAIQKARLLPKKPL